MIKNSLKMISKGAFLASGFAAILFVQSEAQAGYVVQYDNSLGDSAQNKGFGNSLFLQYNNKIDDNWGFNTELLEEFTLAGTPAIGTTSADSTGLNFTHKYIRMNLKRKNAFSLAGLDGAVGFRYLFPTSASNQGQGNLGIVTIRPEVSMKAGSFSMTTKLIVGPYLQRKSTAYVGGAPNPYLLTAVELIPSFDITPTVFVASDFIYLNTLTAGTGGDGFASKNEIENEFEIGYKSDVTNQWAISVVGHTAGTVKGADGDRAYSAGAWDYNLRFAKEF